jgi:hypothetical protein
MSFGMKGTFRGKRIVQPERKLMTAKRASELTIIEMKRWAGIALDYYSYLDEQSKRKELEDNKKESAYQMGQVFYQCHILIHFLLERMAQRDQVITQKDAEIKRLNDHIADLLNRPML